MAGVIRVLPREVADRIAAGEVIERPASVAKELIENALDAGARRLAVDLEEGGVRLVRVTDDGCGMDAEDLGRCVLAHATSKIAAVDDLFRVATFGFRGEALPSIAAVSETTILSRRPEDALGARITVRGGEATGPVPAGAPAGTTVEVRNLFFNVPARRKFLRHARTELAHAVESAIRLLLPAPETALRFTHDGKKVLEVGEDADLRARIRSLFGTELAARLIETAAESGSARVQGLLGPPDLVKSTAEHQYLFLNGRYIRDRSLAFAIKDSYRGLILPRDHPVAFLFLEMDPAEVDVNAHPTKIEVRFRDRDRIHALVRQAVRPALLAAAPDRAVRLEARAAGEPAPSGRGPSGGPRREDPARADLLETLERELFPDGVPPLSAAGTVAEAAPAPRPDLGAAPPPPVAQRVAGEPPARARSRCHDVRPRPATGSIPARAVQVHRSYLVVEDRDGIRIVDQHALHERRLFDELLERFERAEPEAQHLLVPEVVDVAPVPLARLLEVQEDLARFGLLVEAFGPASACVRALPAVLDRLQGRDALDLVLELLADSGPGPDRRELIRRAAAELACRAAVKFGDALPPEEIEALLEWGRRHPAARNCPHGRPVAVSIPLRDLESAFLRKG